MRLMMYYAGSLSRNSVSIYTLGNLLGALAGGIVAIKAKV